MDFLKDNTIIQTLDDLTPKTAKKITRFIIKTLPSRKDDLSSIGVKLTALYFIFIILFLYLIDIRMPDELNEYGDFLAGFFSPIAFGWLVIGYLMQNSELKNQITEFRKNVKLTQEQISQTDRIEKNRLDTIEVASQPIFIFSTEFLKNSDYKWSNESVAYNSSNFGSMTICKKTHPDISDKIINENKKIEIPIKIKALKNDSYNFNLINHYFLNDDIFPQVISKSIFNFDSEIEEKIYLDRNGMKKLLKDEKLEMTIIYVDTKMNNQKLKLTIFPSVFGLGFYINNRSHTNVD